ncbi:MAG: SpoIIE family protein phosphatase [Planctomycetota bacterium]
MGDDQLNIEAYQRILEVARGLAQTPKLAPVLEEVINGMRDVLHAERASVFQYDASSHELFATKAHGLPADLRLPADAGIVGEAARTREIVHIPDAYEDDRFNRAIDASTGFRTRDILSVPLLDPDGTLVGVAQVLNTTTGDGFTSRCKAIAMRLGELAAVAIKRASLIEAEREKERYEADLKIAEMIQTAAQSTELPAFEGYEIATNFQPADETGGDAFDIIDLRTIDGREGQRADGLLFLADATGHGVGPAISSVSTLAMIRIAARLGGSLESIIRAVNEQACEDLPAGRFVTAFVGELDCTRDEIRWQSAGQAPLLHVRASQRLDEEAESFKANGCPMGIMPEFLGDDAPPFALAAGDLFAVLSDGYFETASPSGELFGTKRVLDILHAHKGGPAQAALDTLTAELDVFSEGAPADDDRTGIVVKRL